MKRKLFMLATAMMILALAAPASADFITYTEYASGSVSYLGPTSIFLNITPFDSSLGTLHSVTMSAEVNVSGAAQLWSSDELATLSVTFTNTLAAVSEMGWAPTVASFAGSTGTLYYDDPFGWYATLDGSGNNYAGPTTITTGFGRFAGLSPFKIALTLSGLVSSDIVGDVPEFSYGGNATLTIDYEYTEGTSAVPEPATMLLFGFGLVGLAGLRRFKK